MAEYFVLWIVESVEISEMYYNLRGGMLETSLVKPGTKKKMFSLVNSKCYWFKAIRYPVLDIHDVG